MKTAMRHACVAALVGVLIALPGRAFATAGEDWELVSPLPTGATLNDVTFGGTQFVAVGGAILTSPDGVTWTVQASSTTTSLRGVAWSGTRFVAVGSFGTILVSRVSSDVVIDFGAGVGTWKWMNDSAWVPLHGLSPEVMVTGNVDGS